MEAGTDGRVRAAVGRRHAMGVMGAAATGVALAGRPAAAAGSPSASTHVLSALSADIVRVGSYACLHVAPQDRARAASAPVVALAERLGLVNECYARDGHPSHATAYLKRVGATPAQLADPGLLDATAVVHVAAPEVAIVAAFEKHLTDLLRDSAAIRFLRGCVQPTQYTGNRMYDFAYAQQVAQQTGARVPNAFLVPLSKTTAWWDKSWMQRHTYFLPYSDAGQMVSEGHALAASRGVASLMRRT